jgi:DNA-binding MarR family transcriptional regulator
MHDMEVCMIAERDVVENCACHKVRMAARAVTRAYDEAMRPVGLRATQLAILVAAAVDDALSITALAKFMGMDRSTLTRNLAPLAREGLLLLGNEGWRRSRTVQITKQGRSRLREALPLWEKAQETLRRRLGIRRWTDIRSDLDDLIRAA